MKRFLLLLLIIINVFSYDLFSYIEENTDNIEDGTNFENIEENTNNFFDSYLIIRKNDIKSSKSKNLAEIIKEFSNINIKNKKVYSQSTFIINGKRLNDEEKKIYLFLYDKNNIDSIDIRYNIYDGNIVYNIVTSRYSQGEELIYKNILEGVSLELTNQKITYKKIETNSSKTYGNLNALNYKIKKDDNSLNFKLDTSGEEKGFTGRKSKNADLRTYLKSDVSFNLKPIDEISFTGKYFLDLQTDIGLLGKNETNNIKNQNIYQGGTLGIKLQPISFIVIESMYFVTSKKDTLTITNNRYLMAQGNKTTITFNIPLASINSSIRVKGNYSYLSGKNTYNLSVNNNSLPGLPKHQFNTSVEYVYGINLNYEYALMFNVQYIGDDYNNTTKSDSDKSYTTFDLISSFNYKKTLSLKCGVKNILDIKYETIKGYPISSREYFANISFIF